MNENLSTKSKKYLFLTLCVLIICTLLSITIIIVTIYNKPIKEPGVTVSKLFSNAEVSTSDTKYSVRKTAEYEETLSYLDPGIGIIIDIAQLSSYSDIVSLIDSYAKLSKVVKNKDVEPLIIPTGASSAILDNIAIFQWTETYHTIFSKKQTKRGYYILKSDSDLFCLSITEIKTGFVLSFINYHIN